MTDTTDADDKPAYPDGHEPTTPPTERECFDPSTEWVNYWDMHPVDHGGKFVRWNSDRDRWKVVEVTPPSAHPLDPNLYLVETFSFGPKDVWEDPGDPLTEWSDSMVAVTDALHRSPDLPNVPPFLVDIDYYVVDLTTRRRGRQDTFSAETVAEYWDAVRGYGVNPAEVESVSDDALPDGVTDE